MTYLTEQFLKLYLGYETVVHFSEVKLLDSLRVPRGQRWYFGVQNYACFHLELCIFDKNNLNWESGGNSMRDWHRQPR